MWNVPWFRRTADENFSTTSSQTSSVNNVQDDTAKDESWLSWKKIGIISGVTVASAVTAPVLFKGAVVAAGFSAVGITAKSTAAAMMSSAAVANGGGVAAGSTVAVLQSVGAAGLGTAGTAATSATGAGAALSGAGIFERVKRTLSDYREK